MEHTDPGPQTVARRPAQAGRAGGLLSWLFPAPCLGCGCELAASTPLLLCARCAARLRHQPAAACTGCGRPLPPVAAAARCGACHHRPPPWQGLVAAFLYLPPLTAVMRALKFRGGEFLAPALGALLAARLDGIGADVVTAVPLPWTRRLARGYNQAEAIARPLADALRLPYRGLLTRSLRRRQTGLARAERAGNVRDAFRPRRGGLADERVLLVDDVMTTGATLAEAARALRAAGATSVVAAVVARTPRPDWGDPEPSGRVAARAAKGPPPLAPRGDAGLRGRR